VTDFLRANLRERDPDPLVSWAAEQLRHNPVRIRLLATELGISERHLSRRFRAIFGISPKEFARTARLEKVLAARAAGLAWADLSYACGFADQAHMINDTRAILGTSPNGS
jgi:AraC-like DNA-binding protein